MIKQWLRRSVGNRLVWVHLVCRGSKSTTKKRRTKAEIARRRQVFDDTRPHHGDDLIAALEFENFMRDDYKKGAK